MRLNSVMGNLMIFTPGKTRLSITGLFNDFRSLYVRMLLLFVESGSLKFRAWFS